MRLEQELKMTDPHTLPVDPGRLHYDPDWETSKDACQVQRNGEALTPQPSNLDAPDEGKHIGEFQARRQWQVDRDYGTLGH